MTNFRRLQAGSNGPRVAKLERELKERGLLKGAADSKFDLKTKAAVQRFERKQGYNDDGVVGRRVWTKLGLGEAANGGGGNVGPSTKGPKGDGKGVFNAVSMNVKSNPEMSQDKVRHDVRRAAEKGDIIGWQEIGPERYRQEIRNLKGFGHFMPKGLQTPISWRKEEFEFIKGGVRRMHGGLAKVSPHRQVAWVKLRNKETGEVVVHMNTHLVSGAWNTKQQPTDKWRQSMWRLHMSKMGRMVEQFEKQGHPVVITGDFNRNHFKVLGNQVRYDSGLKAGTHGKSTLDYVMSTRHKELKKLLSKVDKNFASDHNGVIVRYDVD